MKRRSIFYAIIVASLLASCGNKTQGDNQKQEKETEQNQINDQFQRGEDLNYDSLNSIAVKKTENLTLISGHRGQDGGRIYFTTDNADSLFARILPDNIKWDEKNEDYAEIEPQFLNKQYKVEYTLKWEPYDPSGEWEELMVIDKMEPLK